MLLGGTDSAFGLSLSLFAISSPFRDAIHASDDLLIVLVNFDERRPHILLNQARLRELVHEAQV
jgi:hypothetical protein